MLVTIYDLCLTLITRVTSRAYVGLPLARDEDWLNMVKIHPGLMFGITASLQKWPSYLRPLLAPYVPARRRLDSYRKQLRIKLDPLIEDRRKANSHPKSKRPVDMLQWLVDSCKGDEASNENIISKLMFLNLAALNTTASALTQIVLKLCQRQEYIAPLREEAESVLSQNDGTWNMSVLEGLRKMDSFMKEATRLNPAGYFGYARVAMKSIQLADGLKIPKGENIGIATGLVQLDESKCKDPLLFDGFRFSNSTQDKPGEKQKGENRFSGTGKSMMAWGVGRTTCPGRWYADAQIKLILAMLLTEFEFHFPDGQTERPDNVVFNDLLMPPKDQKMSIAKLC